MNQKNVRLEKITWDNYRKVLKLRVSKEQGNFVSSNDASLIHAFVGFVKYGTLASLPIIIFVTLLTLTVTLSF